MVSMCASVLTLASGWVIWPFPGPIGKAAESPMPNTQIVSCWAFEHDHRPKLSYPTREQAVGHVVWQAALNARAVDRWKIQFNQITM